MPRSGQRHVRRVLNFPCSNDLPTEIVSLLFAILFPPACDEDQWWIQGYHPLRLGGVCRKWREVAWDTPRLWTTLVIRNYDPLLDRKNENQATILKQWVGRAKGLKLDVYLGRIRTQDKEFSPTPLMITLIECCNQWMRLVLDPANDWKHLFKLQHIQDGPRKKETLRVLDLCSLQSASFHNSLNASIPDLINAPLMQRIALKRMSRTMDLLGKAIHWGRITHLTLEGTGLRVSLVEICRHIPHLRKLDLISAQDVPSSSRSAWNIIEHKQLSDLKVSTHCSGPSVLRELSLPALKVLDFQCKGVFLSAKLFMPFLQRSKFVLADLTVSFPQVESKTLGELLRALPSLQKLTVIDQFSNWKESGLPTSFFKQFDPYDSPDFLPYLMLFSYIGRISPYGDGIQFLEPFIKRSRIRRGEPSQQTLRIDSSPIYTCQQHVGLLWTAQLIQIEIKAKQANNPAFILAQHGDLEFRSDVRRMIRAGILVLVDWDDSPWR